MWQLLEGIHLHTGQLKNILKKHNHFFYVDDIFNDHLYAAVKFSGCFPQDLMGKKMTAKREGVDFNKFNAC